jgi:carbonic anhydrase
MRVSEYSIHKITKKSLAVVSAAAASLFLFTGMGSVSAEEVHWTYYGEAGPEHWGELLDSQGNPAFPLCGEERPEGVAPKQSPINIDEVTEADLSDIQFNYQPTPLNMLNNGHTIRVNYGAGSSITANGVTYNLDRFHFHVMSEHTIEGEHSAMEGHLVHESTNGVTAVVAFLIEEGDANPTFQKILDNMPLATNGTFSDPTITINAAGLLPEDGEYYKYTGSLTTPPCTEGLVWHVLQEPIEVSAEQIAKFEELKFLHHKGQFIDNIRPVQPLNGRQVLESDD